MEPFLHQSDHVITFNWSKPDIGDVIVFKSGHKYLVKRVEKIEKGQVYTRGDNIEMSSDMQPIRSAQVVGRVIFKY